MRFLPSRIWSFFCVIIKLCMRRSSIDLLMQNEPQKINYLNGRVKIIIIQLFDLKNLGGADVYLNQNEYLLRRDDELSGNIGRLGRLHRR